MYTPWDAAASAAAQACACGGLADERVKQKSAPSDVCCLAARLGVCAVGRSPHVGGGYPTCEGLLCCRRREGRCNAPLLRLRPATLKQPRSSRRQHTCACAAGACRNCHSYAATSRERAGKPGAGGRGKRRAMCLVASLALYSSPSGAGCLLCADPSAPACLWPPPPPRAHCSMAKSTNHTAHNQAYKNHRNGIKKVKQHKHKSLKGVSALALLLPCRSPCTRSSRSAIAAARRSAHARDLPLRPHVQPSR